MAEPNRTVLTTLIESINGLRTAVENLIGRAEKAEKRIVGIVIAVSIDLIFTGGFALLYYNQSQTADNLAETRQEVLCPMFATFLGSYNPNTRSPGVDRATYENVFAQLQNQYDHLHCTTPFVPKPAIPAPTPTPPQPR